MPALVVVGILVAVSIYGLIQNQDAATINNVSFAAFHVSVLMTGCWPALAKPRAAPPGDRGGGLSRHLRALVVVMLAFGLGGAALFSALGCGGEDSGARTAPADSPLEPGHQRLEPLPGSLRPEDGRVQPDRPGRRHGRRGTGLRDADRGRRRRLGALRRHLELDEGQPAPRGRADLVPVARRPRRGPRGGLRRRRGRRPRAARRRVPLQPARLRKEALALARRS